MLTVTTVCLTCESPFQAMKKEVKRGYGKYCSKICSNNRAWPKQIKEPNTSCATCQTPLYKSISKLGISRHGLHFCNRICKEKAQRIGGIKELQLPHYGEVSSEYRKIAFQTYAPSCVDCGYARHKRVLQVHHVDSDRTNNQVSNLVIVCPTCHVERHLGLIENSPMLLEKAGIEPAT